MYMFPNNASSINKAVQSRDMSARAPEAIAMISPELEDATDVQGLDGAERDRSQEEPAFLLRSNIPLQSTAASLEPLTDIAIDWIYLGPHFKDSVNDWPPLTLVHRAEPML